MLPPAFCSSKEWLHRLKARNPDSERSISTWITNNNTKLTLTTFPLAQHAFEEACVAAGRDCLPAAKLEGTWTLALQHIKLKRKTAATTGTTTTSSTKLLGIADSVFLLREWVTVAAAVRCSIAATPEYNERLWEAMSTAFGLQLGDEIILRDLVFGASTSNDSTAATPPQPPVIDCTEWLAAVACNAPASDYVPLFDGVCRWLNGFLAPQLPHVAVLLRLLAALVDKRFAELKEQQQPNGNAVCSLLFAPGDLAAMALVFGEAMAQVALQRAQINSEVAHPATNSAVTAEADAAQQQRRDAEVVEMRPEALEAARAAYLRSAEREYTSILVDYSVLSSATWGARENRLSEWRAAAHSCAKGDIALLDALISDGDKMGEAYCSDTVAQLKACYSTGGEHATATASSTARIASRAIFDRLSQLELDNDFLRSVRDTIREHKITKPEHIIVDEIDNKPEFIDDFTPDGFWELLLSVCGSCSGSADALGNADPAFMANVRQVDDQLQVWRTAGRENGLFVASHGNCNMTSVSKVIDTFLAGGVAAAAATTTTTIATTAATTTKDDSAFDVIYVLVNGTFTFDGQFVRPGISLGVAAWDFKVDVGAVVNLSGADATPLQGVEGFPQRGARVAGQRDGRPGRDGASGAAGQSAGHFHASGGSAHDIAQKLLIVLNGGNGANGQRGEDGEDGVDGDDGVDAPAFEPSSYWVWSRIEILEGTQSSIAPGKGGAAGAPGLGGAGGNAGTIKLDDGNGRVISVAGRDNVTCNAGLPGADNNNVHPDPQPGKGGAGGSNGASEQWGVWQWLFCRTDNENTSGVWDQPLQQLEAAAIGRKEWEQQQEKHVVDGREVTFTKWSKYGTNMLEFKHNSKADKHSSLQAANRGGPAQQKHQQQVTAATVGPNIMRAIGTAREFSCAFQRDRSVIDNELSQGDIAAARHAATTHATFALQFRDDRPRPLLFGGSAHKSSSEIPHTRSAVVGPPPNYSNLYSCRSVYTLNYARTSRRVSSQVAVFGSVPAAERLQLAMDVLQRLQLDSTFQRRRVVAPSDTLLELLSGTQRDEAVKEQRPQKETLLVFMQRQLALNRDFFNALPAKFVQQLVTEGLLRGTFDFEGEIEQQADAAVTRANADRRLGDPALLDQQLRHNKQTVDFTAANFTAIDSQLVLRASRLAMVPSSVAAILRNALFASSSAVVDWPALLLSTHLCGGTFAPEVVAAVSRVGKSRHWGAFAVAPSFVRAVSHILASLPFSLQSRAIGDLNNVQELEDTVMRMAVAVLHSQQSTSDRTIRAILLFSLGMLTNGALLVDAVAAVADLRRWPSLLCEADVQRMSSEKVTPARRILLASMQQRNGWHCYLDAVHRCVHNDDVSTASLVKFEQLFERLDSVTSSPNNSNNAASSPSVSSPEGSPNNRNGNSRPSSLPSAANSIATLLEEASANEQQQQTVSKCETAGDALSGIVAFQKSIRVPTTVRASDAALAQLRAGIPHSPEWLVHRLSVVWEACYKWRPSAMQQHVVCQLLYAPRAVCGNLRSGAGKTVVLAMYAAALGLLGGTVVDIVTSNPANALQSFNDTETFFSAVFGRPRVSSCLCAEGISVDPAPNALCGGIIIVYGDARAFETCRLHSCMPGANTRAHMNGYAQRYQRGNNNNNHTVRLVIDEVDAVVIDGASDVLQICNDHPEHALLETCFMTIWALVVSSHEDTPYARVALADLIRRQIFKCDSEASTQHGFDALFVPHSLRHYAAVHIERWVASAFTARAMLEGEYYNLRPDSDGLQRIVPYVVQLGCERFGSEWTHGLTQFLQLKHGLRFTPPNLHSLTCSRREWLRSYDGRIAGLSGTLGSGSVVDVLRAMLGEAQVLFFPSEVAETLECDPTADCIFGAGQEAEWLKCIAKRVSDMCNEDRPVLITCADVRAMTTVINHLLKCSLGQKRARLTLFDHVSLKKQQQQQPPEPQTTQQQEQQRSVKNLLFRYCFDDDELSSFRKLDSFCVIVATARGGRGTDLIVSDACGVRGGLDVIITTARDFRCAEQAKRRAARLTRDSSSGSIRRQNGSCAMINKTDDTSTTGLADLDLLHETEKQLHGALQVIDELTKADAASCRDLLKQTFEERFDMQLVDYRGERLREFLANKVVKLLDNSNNSKNAGLQIPIVAGATTTTATYKLTGDATHVFVHAVVASVQELFARRDAIEAAAASGGGVHSSSGTMLCRDMVSLAKKQQEFDDQLDKLGANTAAGFVPKFTRELFRCAASRLVVGLRLAYVTSGSDCKDAGKLARELLLSDQFEEDDEEESSRKSPSCCSTDATGAVNLAVALTYLRVASSEGDRERARWHLIVARAKLLQWRDRIAAMQRQFSSTRCSGSNSSYVLRQSSPRNAQLEELARALQIHIVALDGTLGARLTVDSVAAVLPDCIGDKKQFVEKYMIKDAHSSCLQQDAQIPDHCREAVDIPGIFASTLLPCDMNGAASNGFKLDCESLADKIVKSSPSGIFDALLNQGALQSPSQRIVRLELVPRTAENSEQLDRLAAKCKASTGLCDCLKLQDFRSNEIQNFADVIARSSSRDTDCIQRALVLDVDSCVTIVHRFPDFDKILPQNWIVQLHAAARTAEATRATSTIDTVAGAWVYQDELGMLRNKENIVNSVRSAAERSGAIVPLLITRQPKVSEIQEWFAEAARTVPVAAAEKPTEQDAQKLHDFLCCPIIDSKLTMPILRDFSDALQDQCRSARKTVAGVSVEPVPHARSLLTSLSLDKVVHLEPGPFAWWDWKAFAGIGIGLVCIGFGAFLLSSPVLWIAAIGELVATGGFFDVIFSSSCWSANEFTWQDFIFQKVVYVAVAALTVGFGEVVSGVQRLISGVSKVATKSSDAVQASMSLGRVVSKLSGPAMTAAIPSAVGTALRAGASKFFAEINTKAAVEQFGKKLTKALEAQKEQNKGLMMMTPAAFAELTSSNAQRISLLQQLCAAGAKLTAPRVRIFVAHHEHLATAESLQNGSCGDWVSVLASLASTAAAGGADIGSWFLAASDADAVGQLASFAAAADAQVDRVVTAIVTELNVSIDAQMRPRVSGSPAVLATDTSSAVPKAQVESFIADLQRHFGTAIKNDYSNLEKHEALALAAKAGRHGLYVAMDLNNTSARAAHRFDDPRTRDHCMFLADPLPLAASNMQQQRQRLDESSFCNARITELLINGGVRVVPLREHKRSAPVAIVCRMIDAKLHNSTNNNNLLQQGGGDFTATLLDFSFSGSVSRERSAGLDDILGTSVQAYSRQLFEVITKIVNECGRSTAIIVGEHNRPIVDVLRMLLPDMNFVPATSEVMSFLGHPPAQHLHMLHTILTTPAMQQQSNGVSLLDDVETLVASTGWSRNQFRVFWTLTAMLLPSEVTPYHVRTAMENAFYGDLQILATIPRGAYGGDFTHSPRFVRMVLKQLFSSLGDLTPQCCIETLYWTVLRQLDSTVMFVSSFDDETKTFALCRDQTANADYPRCRLALLGDEAEVDFGRLKRKLTDMKALRVLRVAMEGTTTSLVLLHEESEQRLFDLGAALCFVSSVAVPTSSTNGRSAAAASWSSLPPSMKLQYNVDVQLYCVGATAASTTAANENDNDNEWTMRAGSDVVPTPSTLTRTDALPLTQQDENHHQTVMSAVIESQLMPLFAAQRLKLLNSMLADVAAVHHNMLHSVRSQWLSQCVKTDPHRLVTSPDRTLTALSTARNILTSTTQQQQQSSSWTDSIAVVCALSPTTAEVADFLRHFPHRFSLSHPDALSIFGKLVRLRMQQQQHEQDEEQQHRFSISELADTLITIIHESREIVYLSSRAASTANHNMQQKQQLITAASNAAALLFAPRLAGFPPEVNLSGCVLHDCNLAEADLTTAQFASQEHGCASLKNCDFSWCIIDDNCDDMSPTVQRMLALCSQRTRERRQRQQQDQQEQPKLKEQQHHHKNSVSCIALSPDGTQLATASSDCTAKLWDTVTGECLHTFSGHTGSVTCVVFSPQQQQQLATSSADGTVKLWSTEAGECLRTLSEHQRCVRSVAFSRDGKLLASCSLDRTVRLWSSETGELKWTADLSSDNSLLISRLCFVVGDGNDDNDTLYVCGFSNSNQRPVVFNAETGARVMNSSVASSASIASPLGAELVTMTENDNVRQLVRIELKESGRNQGSEKVKWNLFVR